MHVDLVQVTTRDGVRLDGMFQPATATNQLVVTGWVFIHGTGGNFYSSTLFDALAARLVELGSSVLRVNTRGHDSISTAMTDRGGRRLGAAFEVVDDCRHDLTAWVGWLRERVGERVGLLGHSLGAVKAIYTLAHEPSLTVACLVAVSPPRLSYSWFCSSPEGPTFLETFQAAEREVEAGRPGTLLEVKLPLPFVVTAAGYVEKYGPDECYNFLKLIGGVRCPTLVTFGEIEAAANMAFRGSAEAAAAVAARNRHIAVETVAKADHFYMGVRPDLIRIVESWLTHRSKS